MSSMYAAYLTERTSDQIIESDEGFATYRFLNNGKSVYIIDIYVKPNCRKSGAASNIANVIANIAVNEGAVEMFGTVVPSTKNSTDSLRVLLAYGMQLDSATNDLIVFKKSLVKENS